MNAKSAVLLCLLIAGCGGGMYTASPNAQNEAGASYATPWGNAVVTKDAFIFGSDYPADIAIPDIDGMRDTAFVVSSSNPSGVIALDLESDPIKVSSRFAGVLSPSGTGMPGSVFILNESRAFLLTSSHVIDFNPTTGKVNAAVNLLQELVLPSPLPLSAPFDYDGDGADELDTSKIRMSYPAGLAAAGGKLYISMSNYIAPVMPAVAAPGIIRIFEIRDAQPYLAESKRPVVTENFNPTGMTPLPGGRIAITVSGVSNLWGGAAHPVTDSSIDIIDTATDKITSSIPLGPSALSFQEIAVTSDGRTGYIGSASYGEVYAVDFEENAALHTHANPIVITGSGEGTDYLSSQCLSYDDWYLLAASADRSSIYSVDVTLAPPDVLPEAFPEPFVLGFSKGVSPENPTGANTGVGAIAVRPGAPGVDFDGPDIFALTGNPGTLVTIKTHGSGAGSKAGISRLAITPASPKMSEGGDSTQLYLSIKFSDGKVVTRVTGTFVNPLSGYPTRVLWMSSEEEVASVDSSGVLVPVSEGTAKITASIGQMSAEADVTVAASKEDASEEKPAEQRNEDAGEDDGTLPILSRAPRGTNPFADRVVRFSIGAGGGRGMERMPNAVLGPPRGEETGLAPRADILSLGRGGQITIEMTDFIIADGEGPDFTVFENAFFIGGNRETPYSEPAVVSVSEDGRNFAKFDCDLASPPLFPGCAGTFPTFSNPENGIDPTDPDVSGGNQFDLADVGLETARFVRITDGGVRAIAAAPSIGFDLDAVVVINGVIAGR